jgi:type IV fimbrial biogenesis protein FimT
MVMHGQRAASGGFTLTELLIALAIAAILATLGAPAMGNLLARTREAGAEASMAGSLRHARTIAVMHNTRVVVCPSRDGRHCRKGDDWQHGWLIGGDGDHDGQPDAGAQALTVVGAMPAGIGIVTSAGRGQIIFHPNGNAAGSNVRFTICQTRAASGKSVILANSGRVRIADAEPERLRQCLASLQ